MKLTKRQREVLAHVVVDPTAWMAHNLDVSPTKAEAKKRLEAKVANWEKEYDKDKNQPGYKNRKQRDKEVNQ